MKYPFVKHIGGKAHRDDRVALDRLGGPDGIQRATENGGRMETKGGMPVMRYELSSTAPEPIHVEHGAIRGTELSYYSDQTDTPTGRTAILPGAAVPAEAWYYNDLADGRDTKRGDTWFVDFSIGQKEATPTSAAANSLSHGSSILYGADRRYSKSDKKGFGKDSWLYRVGESAYRMSLTATVISGASTTYLGPGQTWTLRLTVRAFLAVDGGSETAFDGTGALVLQQDVPLSHPGTLNCEHWSLNATPNAYLLADEPPPIDYIAPSPSGELCYINFLVKPTTQVYALFGFGNPLMLPLKWACGKVWLLDLSAGLGSPTLSVARTEAECMVAQSSQYIPAMRHVPKCRFTAGGSPEVVTADVIDEFVPNAAFSSKRSTCRVTLGKRFAPTQGENVDVLLEAEYQYSNDMAYSISIAGGGAYTRQSPSVYYGECTYTKTVASGERQETALRVLRNGVVATEFARLFNASSTTAVTTSRVGAQGNPIQSPTGGTYETPPTSVGGTLTIAGSRAYSVSDTCTPNIYSRSNNSTQSWTGPTEPDLPADVITGHLPVLGVGESSIEAFVLNTNNVVSLNLRGMGVYPGNAFESVLWRYIVGVATLGRTHTLDWVDHWQDGNPTSGVVNDWRLSWNPRRKLWLHSIGPVSWL